MVLDMQKAQKLFPRGEGEHIVAKSREAPGAPRFLNLPTEEKTPIRLKR